MKTIETRAKKSELLSPKDFINLSEADKKNIRSMRILPPKLGRNSFGKIEVFYRTKKYETV